MSKLYSLYENLKKDDEKTVYLFKSGIFYIALSDDAIYLSNKFNFKLTKLNDKIVKCGFPISSSEKYIKIFTNNNINFKFIDVSNNTMFMPNDYKMDANVKKILADILSVNPNKMSVSEAYEFIEDLQNKIKIIEKNGKGDKMCNINSICN